jgi:hypothetical protein
MMNEFFTREQLENFFANEEQKINLEPIIKETDFAPAFDALSKAVMESSFAGESALEALKEPFSNKMKAAVIKIVNSSVFNETMQNHLQKLSLNEDMISSIESVIDTRLNELTPELVKEMVQTLIKEHLDWLVVWVEFLVGLLD